MPQLIHYFKIPIARSRYYVKVRPHEFEGFHAWCEDLWLSSVIVVSAVKLNSTTATGMLYQVKKGNFACLWRPPGLNMHAINILIKNKDTTKKSEILQDISNS